MHLFQKEKYKISNCSKRMFSTLGADLELAISSEKKYEQIMGKIINEMGDIDIRDVDLSKVMTMKNSLNQRNLSASYKNHHCICLRKLLQFMKEVEGVNVLDFQLIKKFKDEKKPVEVMKDEEVSTLLDSIAENCLTRLRLKTFIICLLSTGARISELMNLNKEDVDFEKGLATTKGKGGKINQVIFNKVSLEYLKKYLDMRGDDGCFALFSTCTKASPRRWAINCAERAIRNQGRRAGLKKRIYAHLCRKTVASKMYFAGIPVPIISKFLSHSNSSVTQAYYLRGADFQEVRQAHQDILSDFGRTELKDK